MGRTTDFEFEIIYIMQAKGCTTNFHLVKNWTSWVMAEMSKMNDKVLKEGPWFQALPKGYRESLVRSINPTMESPQNPTP